MKMVCHSRLMRGVRLYKEGFFSHCWQEMCLKATSIVFVLLEVLVIFTNQSWELIIIAGCCFAVSQLQKEFQRSSSTGKSFG